MDRKEFQERLASLDKLLQSAQAIQDPEVQATTQALVQALLDLHGAGLERALEMVYAACPTVIDELAGDEVVGHLMLLHGLHPLSLEARVLQALEKVRPYMRSHGGGVELLGATEAGAVRLRLEGSCQGCPSSRITLKYAVEEAIYAAAPDVTAIEVVGEESAAPPAGAGFIPLAQVGGAGPAQSAASREWLEVKELASLGEGGLRTLDLAGQAILFCRLDNTLYAYGSLCANCGERLGTGRLMGKDLACPDCGHRFDLMRAGRDLDAHQLYLEPFPLLHENGAARVAVPMAGAR
jgi:Fe-S cluster biogenesis protein NfuA/nitrite reductase/ring-hydroxylating ferredoxin subunit